jgi:hypothetical protein
VSTNRDQQKELEVKLTAIHEIVKKYQQHSGIEVLRHRVESFCECVRYLLCCTALTFVFQRAIKLQVDAVQHLHDRPAGSRVAESAEDADKITKAFRNMGILCDVFQVGLHITEMRSCSLITLVDGHAAEYRANRKYYPSGMVVTP